MNPIKILRKRWKSGERLESLARECDVAASTLSRIFAGKMQPTLPVMERLARAAGLVLVWKALPAETEAGRGDAGASSSTATTVADRCAERSAQRVENRRR